MNSWQAGVTDMAQVLRKGFWVQPDKLYHARVLIGIVAYFVCGIYGYLHVSNYLQIAAGVAAGVAPEPCSQAAFSAFVNAPRQRQQLLGGPIVMVCRCRASNPSVSKHPQILPVSKVLAAGEQRDRCREFGIDSLIG